MFSTGIKLVTLFLNRSHSHDQLSQKSLRKKFKTTVVRSANPKIIELMSLKTFSKSYLLFMQGTRKSKLNQRNQ